MKLKNTLILIITIISFMFIKTVSAYQLSAVDSPYKFTRYDARTSLRFSETFKYYSIDDVISYCIEPAVHEGVNYRLGSFEELGYSQELKEKITLIGYYGYSYPGHQTLKMRMATQALIWNEIMGYGSWVKFNSDYWQNGTIIRVDDEEKTILDLVEKHRIVPSFSNTTSEVYLGSNITLHDDNEVLDNFNISVNDASYEVRDNDLIITPSKKGQLTINLEQKINQSESFKVYMGDDIQAIFSVGDPGATRASATLNVLADATVEIYKKDRETTYPLGTGTLEGATYGIYKESGELVYTLTTDSNGYAIKDGDLINGDYYVEEIMPSYGYERDTNKYYFSITQGNDKIRLDVYETPIKKRVNILKQYSDIDDNPSFLNSEDNIQFEIKKSDGTVYTTITTDNNGYASLILPYGEWTFHQVNSKDGYSKIYDFIVTVNENTNDNYIYSILDSKFSAYIKVYKKDLETGNLILKKGAKFKIFNKTTNNYVTQFVGGKLKDEFETNETGMFTTDLKIGAGEYRLIETEAPLGYILNTSGLDFSISDTLPYINSEYGPIFELTYQNKAIKGQIELLKTGEVFTLNTYEFKPLNNIEFDIYCNDNILTSDNNSLFCQKDARVGTMVTNSHGYAISALLPLGSYYVKEKNILSNYRPNNEKYEVTFSDERTNQEVIYKDITVQNSLAKGNIKVIKYGEELDLINGYITKPLSGVVFDIFTKNDITFPDGTKIAKNTKVDTITTTNDGIGISTELPLGEYYIKEKSTLSSYQNNNNEYIISLNIDRETKELSITNILKKNKIEITKLGEKGIVSDNQIEYTNIPLEEIEFEIYTDEDIIFPTGGKIPANTLVEIVKTNDNGIAYSNLLPLNKYYIKEKTEINNYIISTKKYKITNKDSSSFNKITINNTLKKGQIEIIKTGEEYQLVNDKFTYVTIPLSDIEFEIYNTNDIEYLDGTKIPANTLIKTVKTNGEGKVTSSLLPMGEYYIKEKTTSNNYVPNTNIYNVNLTGSLKTSTTIKKQVKVHNELKKGTITVTKYGEKLDKSNLEYKKIKLSNICFDIYTNEDIRLSDTNIILKDTKIENVCTNKSGILKSSLIPYGKYYLKETTNLDNYIQNDNKYIVDLKEDNISLDIYNTLMKGQIEIIKTGEELDEKLAPKQVPLEDVSFELYTKNDIVFEDNTIIKKDTKLATLKTDTDGKIVTSLLPIGEYYIKEVKTNDMYNLNDKIYNIRIDGPLDEDTIVYKKITINNILKKSQINIQKLIETLALDNSIFHYEWENKENICFNIFNKNDIVYPSNYTISKDTLLETVCTNSNGQIMSSLLPYGDYYFTELPLDNKYIPNTKTYYFTLSNNKSIKTETVRNYLKKGELQFIKKDSISEEVIPNVLMELYDNNDNLIWTERTDSNGKINITDLKVGTYYLVEKETPENYLLSNEKIYFEIKDNGDIANIVLTNEKIIPIEVIIPKTYQTNHTFKLSISFILLGLNIIINEKKKKYI